jgi:hypothetical protein
MSTSDCPFGYRACSWFNSPEYKKIRAVGEKYAKYRNFAVPGAAQ